MINKAIMFATLAHENKRRKVKDIPYILHPMETAAIVSRMTYDEDLICAAWLHDTIEDAKFTYDSIATAFNKRIADIIIFQSEDKTKTWKERKQHTLNELQSCNDDGIKMVLLADKLCNVRDMHRSYDEIGEKLWESFTVKDKKLHGWYFMGLCNGLASLEGYDAYKEYKALVTSGLFGD